MNRKNYGLAQQHASRFFERVREVRGQRADPSLEAVLNEALTERDAIIAALARGDAAVQERVRKKFYGGLLKAHPEYHQPRADKSGMALFAWNDAYTLAVPEIDRQHQQLFAYAGQLHSAMMAGQGREVLAPFLANLGRLHPRALRDRGAAHATEPVRRLRGA